MGLPRSWPEVFDEMLDILDKRGRGAKRDSLQAMARKQFGG